MAKTPNGFSDRDPDAIKREMAIAQMNMAKAFLKLSRLDVTQAIPHIAQATRAAFSSAKIKTGVALIGLGCKLAP